MRNWPSPCLTQTLSDSCADSCVFMLKERKKDVLKRKPSQTQRSELQTGIRGEGIESMIRVCNCFKIWQQPAAHDEEEGKDDKR